MTPDEVVEVARPRSRAAPTIDWDELTEDKIAAIPVLGRLREELASG